MTQEELEILLKDLQQEIDKNRTSYIEKKNYLHNLKKSHEADFVEEHAKFKFEMTFDDDSGTWEIEESYYDSYNGGICYSCWLSDTFNGCKIFTEAEIENLINKPVVKISLEELKQKKKEVFDKISKEEQACHKVCEELKREYVKVKSDYIEQNRLYPNGFKFIDDCGDFKEISYATMYNDAWLIAYVISAQRQEDCTISEIQITNFLNNNKQ